jgi:flagellar biosynthesis/type III secretory pathway chaperone
LSQEIQSPAQFAASLKTEHGLFRDFYALLETEHEALTRGDIDALVELARVKTEKVATLNQMAASRGRYLTSQGVQRKMADIERWLAAHGGEAGEELLPLWFGMLETARQSQRLNEENGALIAIKLRHNAHALSILQTAATQAGLYGPDGQAHAYNAGRPLGEA